MIKPFEGKDIAPHNVTVVDIETSPSGDVIGIGFAYEIEGIQHYASYENTAQWYNDLRVLFDRNRSNKDVIRRLSRIFAHNGAGFDYLKLYADFAGIEAIENAQYITADSAGIGATFNLKGIKPTLYMMDSYRLMPASLAALGKTYKTQNQKDTVPAECKDDYLRFKNEYPDLFWQYLKNDVISLQQIIKSFWQGIYTKFGNVGQLPMTLPALALRIFSKQLSAPIMVPENKKLKAFERRSYKGGLMLCLNTGVFDNVNVYDVNSMYPYAMVQHEYPSDYAGYWTSDFEPESTGLWECEYNAKDKTLPPILFDTVSGAAYAGNGIFSTNELNYVFQLGYTVSVKIGYVYERKAPLFQQFISSVYADRKQAVISGDEATAFTLKILMNSLYGKFAQRESGDTIVWYHYDELDKLMEQGKKVKILGDFMVYNEEREVPHVFVAIAAMITANARIDLHRRMTDVIRSGYSVYYCDTDSIHTNGVFDESNTLGGIKLENTGRAAYAGKKLYAFENGKIKAKGIGRRTVGESLSFADIALMAMNKDVIKAFSFEGFPSVKGVLSKREKAAVMRVMTRSIRNTGGIWDNGV